MFGGRIAFVDDYDLHVAHFLVQGCDVWLNNPRKPLEASGTSGMKAAINGVPHLSIGDGWWAEGLHRRERLADRRRSRAGDDHDAVDAADAEALYQLLEHEVVPTFYDRDAHGIPRRWLAIVKQAIRSVTPRFSARRMVKEYAERDVRAGDARQADVDERASGAVNARQVHALGVATMPRSTIRACPGKRSSQARCALCGAKDVSEPRGEERYCRDCWDKKIAVEEIVAREFALKRYIRAHSAEKYLIYHSTLKRPCGQLIVVDDGYDLFLTMVLYPELRVGRAGLSPRGRPRRTHVRRDPRRRRRRRGHRAVGRRQVAPRDLPVLQPRSRRTGTARCRPNPPDIRPLGRLP